jgi:acyl-[acyl-carrier-protein]-phospholipid O-acyltransferase/long-chain-fatty-acid--[acyl-carrier-protein] ligase
VADKTSTSALRRCISELMVEAFSLREADTSPLHRAALRTLRQRPFHSIAADPLAPDPWTGHRFLAAAVLLGTRLKSAWRNDQRVGILLPPSVHSALVNFSAALAGKTACNLNYTAPALLDEELLRRHGIRLVVTSKRFQSRLKLELPEGVKVLYLEDLKAALPWPKLLWIWIKGLLLPACLLERSLGAKKPADPHDVATLIFTSGSTGRPKAVPLTHWNIQANLMGMNQQMTFPRGSRFLGLLPFFHAFGYTATLWFPLTRGKSVVYAPNPLHTSQVGTLAMKYRVTHLLATPSFLTQYLRRIPRRYFESLRVVVTGAEKLHAETAKAFEKRFGVAPLQGYGCTECAPVVALNREDHHEPGMVQRGHKAETVGHPLPGVAIRVVDPDTFAELPAGETGMLLVKGPNVMQGYSLLPRETAEVLKQGWYVTGDVASVDEEGFITLVDRLSRFAKIGGEMVPLIRIEEALQQAGSSSEPVFAVTNIPDPVRGERICVLHTLEREEARRAYGSLLGSGLPPLWIPRWNDFMQIDSLPILGTGKRDLKKVREVAIQIKALAESA